MDYVVDGVDHRAEDGQMTSCYQPREGCVGSSPDEAAGSRIGLVLLYRLNVQVVQVWYLLVMMVMTMMMVRMVVTMVMSMSQ